MCALPLSDQAPQLDAALRVPPADWMAIPPNRRQATLRKFKKLGDELIADLNVRLQDASERGKDLEAILRDLRRQEREQVAFVQEVERFRGVISKDAHRSGADLDFLEKALAVDQEVLAAFRSCRRELEALRRQRLQEYTTEWSVYLSNLKESPEHAALAARIEEFWQWVSRELWAPAATPTDEGFLLIWDRDDHHLEVELFRDGSYDWLYRNRESDMVSYEEDLPSGCWTPRLHEAISALRVQDLTERIEALDPHERLELLRRVVTPELELRLLVEGLRQKVRVADPRAFARDVNRAVREVRSRRRLSQNSRS